MINNHRNQALYFSEHKYFQQTQVVYQGDIFWVFLCVFCLAKECVLMHGCFSAGVIPDETKALSLLAPANAVAGLLPGGGLLPTPNPLTQIGAVPLAALGAPTLDPALAALGLPGANLNSQSLAADQLLKLMSTVDPKLNHVAAGLVSPSLKSDTSSKEIEEAMKRVREAQSLISAAIEPDKKEEKRRHSRSRSRSRRRRTPSSSRHRRSRSRSRRRSHSKSRSRRRSKSPRRRRSHSRERGRRSRSTSKNRDKKKEDKEKKRSKTPPKSYSTARRSRSASSLHICGSRERRRRRSRSGTRSPKKPRSPKRKLSRSPSPRRHKKEKKKDKDKERSRDERERSTSKKKKSKDKEKERERKSESDKDVKQVTRDYDEEEQGYDSEKEKKEEKKLTEPASPKAKECSVEKGTGDSLRESKVNGDDHHEEDMDMSD
ncbi:serine/arginine-rich splicing factor 11 isoform X4 [Phocoena sinus]|uniref:Serine/arginine-rich splicing factor 11 isoform X6 n=1 Tax=Tursiops truncatus TaxID=9739 RepID=A0A2U4A1X9_TURTR|nr:serine/arginine-rich splicing factor 11 isoform X6 [Tursiops truncatus]XP_026969860.1 serine/arginine-rich splicing factor 11 isoform X6 [Lagenorhynchus obliquidens]XP_026969861.1 serine/arginine-rich splicing factor 11 isoform X6 [Lagenorhynchus obliquidens]XP_030721790.1 serine/arginine-rich splicing factor 11 isoform X6 [Globicephala melas]XP_032480573.1 serine/arginine-rich splicing factor 11 isoform X4 [Phocoena sinus]XP_032480574.1 serine/arginine-rich splicing factor 11 isoform X4 [P